MASSFWMRPHCSRTKLPVFYVVQPSRSTGRDAAVFLTDLLLAPVRCVCEGFNLLNVVPIVISFNLVLCLICQFWLHFPYNEFPFRGLLHFPALLPLCQRKKVLNPWTSIGRGKKVRVLFPSSHEVPLLLCGFVDRSGIQLGTYNPSAQWHDGEWMGS